jgi:hypothetical protein
MTIHDGEFVVHGGELGGGVLDERDGNPGLDELGAHRVVGQVLLLLVENDVDVDAGGLLLHEQVLHVVESDVEKREADGRLRLPELREHVPFQIVLGRKVDRRRERGLMPAHFRFDVVAGRCAGAGGGAAVARATRGVAARRRGADDAAVGSGSVAVAIVLFVTRTSGPKQERQWNKVCARAHDAAPYQVV